MYSERLLVLPTVRPQEPLEMKEAVAEGFQTIRRCIPMLDLMLLQLAFRQQLQLLEHP
jgi:hypothetical protein